MKKLCLPCLLALACLSLAAAPALAQEMAPKKFDGTWFQVFHVDFKEGMREAALAHIEQYFVPAAMKTGTHPDIVFVHHTGGWDLTVGWALDGGPADLAWEMSPDDIEWMKAMAEATGGMDQAMKAWNDYQAMIARSETILVRSFGGPPAPGEGGGEGNDGE